MKYIKKQIDADLVKEISAQYKTSLLLASILVRRNIIDPLDIMFILESDMRYIHNPFLFHQMEDVVDRIHSAAEEGEKVIVFGDRDTDGITSTVLLVKKLREIGIDVSWSLPSGDDMYGFTEKKVEDFAKQNGSLIITVDCGISSAKEIAYAATLGIDTIIIDHHMPGEVLPEAFAIINPKMEDCGYPFRHLAACGVVSKVIWALAFSETELYKKEISLLNIVPGNGGTYIAEAQKIFNLVKSDDPVRETFMPGIISDLNKTPLVKYISNSIIVVYSAKQQKHFFSEIFGKNVDLSVVDIALESDILFPRLKGLSLLQMRELSKDSRYYTEPVKELDVLFNLFTAVAMKKNNLQDDKFKNMADFVTISSIADMMPLVNENRIIVKHGIENIKKTSNKGLHELLYRQKLLEKPIATTDIAWNITPLINATGRLGVPEKAAQLFFSDDIEEIRVLANEIISLNKERKKLGDNLWDTLFDSAKKSFEEFNNSLIFIGGKQVNRGITGILSARLASHFNVPAAVYTVLEDKIIVGSIRSAGSYPIMAMMNICSDIFMDFGGHDFAGGFSLEINNLDEMKKRFTKYVKNNAITAAEKKDIEIDAELPEGYLNQDVIEAVNALKPFGEGNPELVFLARSLKIKTIEIIGNKSPGHIKLVLESKGVPWSAIFWNAADRAGKDFSPEAKVDVLFKIKNNFFANNNILQLDIINMERVG
ncbi:MAG: single-stranded-DNA-specific exonuclease RecJ [Spirochaetes bacterium]|nr:single-stranded-DNA-specific exonuclease RecJ [Spirochaetota bacterium]